MSDVLRNLREFRKEKEKIKLEKEEIKEEKIEKKVEKKGAEDGKEWDFLLKAEPVSEDYEDRQWISTPVAFVLYVIGQSLAIWTEFGCVFLIISLIFFTYWNTGRRRRGEMSAYSVFNQNCERLAGSMTAEHFERDMLRQRR
ncbi:hypothetical protein CRE_14874 [Caenorhabditis remanei]|uniref:SAYSvFN domain-containing protein n=1 Tax=Caenorhabditis remanei TaxID=31234 RepID=E3N1U4_CAERE|nr:hypothetical protein CRE_14874 [Caenorhabditis remanei]